MVVETGFNTDLKDVVRIVDDYPTSTSKWSRQSRLSADPDSPEPGWQIMAQTADKDWHTLKVFRTSPGTAGFQIDESPVEKTTSSVCIAPAISSHGPPLIRMFFASLHAIS